MEPKITAILLLLFGFSHSVPVAEWSSNQCSSRCSSDPQFIRFDNQKTYEYRLQTKTVLNGNQELVLDALVEVSAHSPCDLSLQLRETRFQGVRQSESLQLSQQLEEQPIQFGYDNGVVTDLCPSQQDYQWAIDVKKAVISSLQMSATSLDQRSTVLESDILGDCETTYQPMTRRYSTAVMQKTKQLNKCSNRQLANVGLFPRSFSSSYSSLPVMNATFQCVQTVDKDLISGATCYESQILRGLGTHVTQELNLRFEKQFNGLNSRRANQFYRNNLKMSARSHSSSDLSSVLRSVCQSVQSDDPQKSVHSFPELVSALSEKSSEEIQRVAKAVQSQQICSSNQVQDLFLDASALSGSQGGAQVLLEAYQSGTVSHQRSNYLFSLLAFTSSPDEKAVETLQPLLKSRETPKHVVLGISGLIHNLKQVHQNEGQSQSAIDNLLERMSSQSRDSSVVATIKALQNIGLEKHQKGRQQLMKVSQDANKPEAVRSAAIKALSEAMDSKQRQQMIEIFKRENESNEIRINAYKAAVMSGADTQQLQQIQTQTRNERNKDVQQFVRSHQKNLKESSDPHKRYVLPSNSPKFEQPSNQWMGVSNNYESSFIFDALSMGVVLEADVIQSKDSSIPRSMTANITVPAFGRELQLFEVEIRQKGFESIIQQKMRQMKSKSGQSLVKQMIAEAFDIISSADQWSNSVNSRDVEMQIHVKVDGKTILSVDASDAKADWQQSWNQLKQQLDQRFDIDRAFAVQPINTRIQLPSTNGLPIVVRLNATLVSSLKASAKVSDFNRNSNSKVIDALIAPSFALQVEAGVEFMASNQKKAIEVVSRLSSSPVWDSKAEIRENRIANFKINLPKDKQSLVRAESQVYERDETGVRKAVHNWSTKYSYDYKACTESMRKPFGLQICAEVTSQPMAYELSIEKSDRTMKSIELNIETPQKESSDLQNYRISYNTPNSEVDRELSAEVQIQNPSSGRQVAKVEVRSPWIRYSVEAGLRNEDKEQSIQLDVQKDGRKAFSFDFGLESQQRGQKREYRPRVRIETSRSEPIQMQGSVSVSKGRKNQLQIQLEGNQKQFLKGSFVREGERKSNDIRVSSDLSANFPGIEVRVTGVAEKGVKHAETDLTIEYRIRQHKKESVKISAKVQNLTQSQLTKVSAFSELTSTQWPSANFHLAYNLLAKPEQQLENEMTLAWTQQLKSKIHVLHVTKLSQQSANERKLENTLNVEITPLDIDYELRANAESTSGQNQQSPKISAEVVGKDRTGRKENDVRASFQYEQVSHAPLHLTLEANLKTKSRDMQYKDELRERAEGEYQGNTSLQWNKGQKAEFEYNYKNKGQLHHEIDAQIRIQDKHTISHQGLLKMSRNDFQLKSKLSSNESPLYSIDSYLSRDSPSRVECQTMGYAVKANADPYSVPQLASVEVWTPSARISPFSHKTNVEFIPQTSIAVKSDTKRNNRQVVALDAHVSRTAPSRLVWNSEPIEGRFDCDLLSDKRAAALALKSQTQDWSHASSWSSEPQQLEYELKSKTVSKGKPMINVESNWNRRSGQNSFLNVEVPQYKSSLSINGVVSGRQRNGQLELLVDNLKHNTNFEFGAKNAKISSKTDQNRRQVHSLDYSSANGVHSLDSELFQNYKISGETHPFGDEPYVTLNGQSKSQEFNTQNKISKQNNKIQIESKSKQRGQQLADFDVALSPSYNHESRMSYSSPQTRARVQSTPSSSAQFEWECPQYSHSSSGKWNPNDYSLDSKTILKQKNNQFLNFDFKHNLKMSRIGAKCRNYEGELQLDGPESAQLQLLSKDRNYPFSHSTRVSQTNGKQLNVDSRTDSQSQNVFSLNSQINENSPSTLALQYGQHFTAKARAQPFGSSKQLTFEAKHPDYTHVSVIGLDHNTNSLSVKSRTDDNSGRPFAKVDAFLTRSPDMRSHVSLVAKNSNANLEYEPQKSAKFELNAQPYSHKSEIYNNQNQMRIQSKTARSGDNVLDINSRLNPWQQSSHLNINCPQFETQMSGIPSQRTAKIQFKTQSIDHSSDFAAPPSQRSLTFNSNTNFNQRNLAKIMAQLNGETNNEFEVEIPHFAAKSALNWAQKSASVDYRSKIPSGRHVLASVAFNKGFHSDISWDAEKDPNQRLVIVVDADKVGNNWSKKQYVYSFSATYAGNEAKLLSQMTPSEPLKGPHEIQMDFTPKYNPQRDSMSLNVKHEIKDNRMECYLQFKEALKEKFSAKLNAKLESGDESGVSVQLETNAPSNPDLQFQVSLNERHSDLKRQNAKIFAELKALKTSLNQQFLISANIKRENNQMSGSGRLETPQTGPHDLQFTAQDKQFKVWSNGQSGKKLELNANYDNQKNYEANVELKSDVNGIPSISGQAVISGEEASLFVDVDQQRKVDFSALRKGDSKSSGYELSGRLETSFWPKFETKNTYKQNSNEIEVQSNTKYNYKEIASLELDAKRQSGVWSGNARMAANGAELAKASIESSFGSNAMNYILNAKSSQISPIKVQFSSEKISSHETKVSINACSGSERCVDVKTQWKTSPGSLIPEKSQISVSKMGTNFEIKTSFMEKMPKDNSMSSLLGVTQNESPKQRTRNQFIVGINSHSIGFDSIQSRRSRGYDVNLRMHFPSNRVIQIKQDFADRNRGPNKDVTSRTQLIVDQSQPLVEAVVKMQTNDQRISAQIEVSSQKFGRSPKTASFEMQRAVAGKPFAAKLHLDLAKNPNDALTVDSSVTQRSVSSNSWSSSNSYNTTWNLSVSTRDKRSLDFEMSAHVSPMTAAVHYRNVNRRGQQKRGTLLWKQQPNDGNQSEKRFEIQIQDNDNDYTIDGSVGQNAIQLKVKDERSQGQSDVRISSDSKCIRFESKSQSNQRKRYDFCANVDNRLDKILSFSLEKDSQKQLEVSLELDRRDQKSLKLSANWSPEEWQRMANNQYSSEKWNQDWNQWIREIAEEVSHKSRIVSRQFEKEALMPLASLVSDQISDVIQEVFNNFHGFQAIEDYAQRVVQYVGASAEWLQENGQQYYRWIVRSARRQCKRSQMCYKAIYALENYGLASAWDLVTDNTIQALKKSHRLVMTTSGRVYQSLPSLPDWAQEWTQEYRQSVQNAIESVINSNDDFREIVSHVKTIAREVTKNSEQIDWNAVKTALSQMSEIVFSSQSSSRVVVWEPKRGKASLEIRSPAVQSRRFRAVLKDVNQSNIKSMFL